MEGTNPVTLFPALTRWSAREILPGLSTSRHGNDQEEARRASLAVLEALEMARGKGLLPSPTELCLDMTKTCTTLPPLRWHHWDNQPYKMRLTNTGCTVMVSAKWRSKVRAHLTGGPLLGRYVFSQLHFHWGQEDTEGSEHTLEGESFPLEMHMVLFKSRYLTQEAALKEMDGVVEVAYFFEISKKDNPQLEPLVEALSKVTCAMKSTRFGPLALSELVPSFTTDYLMYMGSLLTGKCAHALTWIVRYQPLSISKRQLKALRSVHGLDGNPLLKNWRKAFPPMGRTVLHVLPPGSKKVHKGDQLSEPVPTEKRQTRFTPDWAESDADAPADEDSPKKRRRFFGCFGKKNQDATEESASLPTTGSSGDSESSETTSIQPWLPGIASQKPQCYTVFSDSMFAAMCETSYLVSMSSSSQHSSTTGEDAHDSRQETVAAGDTQRRQDVTNAAKHRPLDVGVMLLQPPELRRGVGATFLNPSEHRRSTGLTFLEQKAHRRAVMRPFNPLLSEVEEESDRASEAIADAADSDSECTVTALEENGLLIKHLPPLKSSSSVTEEKKESSSMKDEDLEADGNMSVEISTCSLSEPVLPSDSLIFEPSFPIGQGSETSLLPAINEDSHGSVESDSKNLSANDERNRNVTSGDSKSTESAQCVEDILPAIPTFHRCWKGGISWWVPLLDNHNFTSDDDDSDAEGSSRNVAQSDSVDKFSLLANTIADNCLGIIGKEIFSDTSTTTDTPQTAITADQKCIDLLTDSTVNLSSKESNAQQSSEEQEALASIWQSQISERGFKDTKNTASLSLSGHEETHSKNPNSSPKIDTLSSNLYSDVATKLSIYPEETYQTNDSDVSYTSSARSRAQKRFDEEELRFPEIRIPKRNNHKPKVQKKRTCLSLSTLQELHGSNTSRTVFQRTTKDGKVKDRLNSWREMQSRKRSSRKSENKKQNRSKRRHHSSSSMDHLLHESSSEDRSTTGKKANNKLMGPAAAKTSNTVFPDGKSTKGGYECRRRDRSNSSSSGSSIFSSSGTKCIDNVVDGGGIQELTGTGNEMELQEISFHYVRCRAGAAPLNRKHPITAADHGDSAIGKSPSTLRLHLKKPVDMSQLLKKVPSGSYITIESPGAYIPEREVTVGMVLVDTLRCEEGREISSSSAQDMTAIKVPQTYPQNSEYTPIEDSKDLSTSAPIADCSIHECASATQLPSVVHNTETQQMENLEDTTSSMSTITDPSPHRSRCCNGECWICQLSTIKVIQCTQGLDNSRSLPVAENSEKVVIETPNSEKSDGKEDEIAAPAIVPTNAVQKCSSVFSRKLGTVRCSSSNERIPVPEPVPVGDVPLQENRREDPALQSAQNGNTVLESRDTCTENPILYRTTVELRLSPVGTILGGNSNSSSNGGERTIESIETSKEVLSEEQKAPQMVVYAANSNSYEDANNTVPVPTANDGNKRDAAGKKSTEIIDIYRKIKRRSQGRSALSMEGIHETLTMDALSSYTSCATESDVSFMPCEDEAVPASSNTQSLLSGEDFPTSQNQGNRCAGTSKDGGRDFFSYQDQESTLKSFRLEYDILSKVMLYATLRQLEISSTSMARAAGAQPCPGNETCGRNTPHFNGVTFQPSLDMEVVRSLIEVPNSKYQDTSTKSTWTEPEELNTTTPNDSGSPQALPVTPEAESRRETEDNEERQQSVPDADGSIVERNSSNTQLLTATSKTKTNSRTFCTISVTLCTKDDKPSNVVEEKISNYVEEESVADSQDTPDAEEIDLSSISISSNTSKCRLKKNTESHKPASVEGSVKQQNLCSVEVRKKARHPDGEPQQRHRPKRRQSRDRILSPREVYERRKMYAKNLALRRAQKANHHAGSEEGEIRSNFDENRSASEERSTGESSQKEYLSKTMKCVDDHQSVGSVKLGEAGNKNVSASKETTVKNFRDTDGKSQIGKKERVVTRMSENLKSGKDTSSCSTCSAKNNSASSNAKGKTVVENRGLRSDLKLPGAREGTMRTSAIGQRRGDHLKEADKAGASIGRSSTSSEHSGGVHGAKCNARAVAVNIGNGRKSSGIHGQVLKNNTANDSALRTPASTKQRGPTENQSKKNLDRKTSPPLGSVELESIEVIDKPSLCETWLQQHYSDSTLGSICGSSSAETTVKTVIDSTKKPDTELKVFVNPEVDSEKPATANESHRRLNKQATVEAEGEVSALPDPQALLPSRERKVSGPQNGEQKLPFGDADKLIIPSRADTVPLLTYKPQKLSEGLKSTHSPHVGESCSVKCIPPTVDSVRAEAGDVPSSQTDVTATTTEAKLLRDKSGEDKHRELSAPEVNDSTGRRSESRELRKASSYDKTTPTTLSQPPSVPDRKSAATSPMPLRKQRVISQDSRQMSLTVETFSFCSTGVNTSLSVTRLSSRSLGVQCPSQAISKRPSATTEILQSIIDAEVKPVSHVYATTGLREMLAQVATKLEKQILVQKSVATQWMRRASVPNVPLKSPGKNVKKTGQRKNRGSSNKRQEATSPKPPLGEYDLGLNEVQMDHVRALHRRRLFRAFSTNSLALGTNVASTKKVMRRLFRKKRKKVKSDATEGRSKCSVNKKKEKNQPVESAAASASGNGNGNGTGSQATGETTNRGGETTEPTTPRSSATNCARLSDTTGGVRNSREHKLREADQKDGSPRLLLLRGAETAQTPALFEDLEGDAAAGPNWCSVHNRAADDGAGQGGAGADAEEVSAAVAQVNTGARVLRVSLADEESTGCSDLGSVEFVVGGGEACRQPAPTPSVLARLRQMLTWRS